VIKTLQRAKYEILFLLLGIGLLACTVGSEFTRQQNRFIPPPPIFRHFHFGYNETLADLFWIRVVQDFSVCEEAIDSFAGTNAGVTCRKGWVFQMLDLVTDLAPRFQMPYYYGATNLSVLVNDPSGAKIIFDKGLKQMPDVWDISYRAAYHYLIELKDKETAAKLLIQAGKNGAPPWVFSLAGRLYTEEGKAFLAKSVLLSALESQPEGPAAKTIRKRLKLIDAELAKSKQTKK
jgi:hypothetical protein